MLPVLNTKQVIELRKQPSAPVSIHMHSDSSGPQLEGRKRVVQFFLDRLGNSCWGAGKGYGWIRKAFEHVLHLRRRIARANSLPRNHQRMTQWNWSTGRTGLDIAHWPKIILARSVIQFSNTRFL